MDITLKQIEGIAPIAFDGGQIKIQFGEPLLLQQFPSMLLKRGKMTCDIIYPITLICEEPQNKPEIAVFSAFGKMLLRARYWEISFSNRKEIQPPMMATLTAWYMDKEMGKIWGEFTLPKKPIWPPESITLPIAGN